MNTLLSQPCQGDARVTASSCDKYVAAIYQIASTLNHLVIQDAEKKRRWPSQLLGAWNGVIIETIDKGVFVTVSQKNVKHYRLLGDL